MTLPWQNILVDADGTLLQVWPNPGAGAILFLPGTMLEPGHYALIIARLRAAGLAVASPHFCGHGLRRKSFPFTFQSLLEECAKAEAWLRANGYDRVAVCGHSQGGILALAFASLSPNLAAAFSLCAAFPQDPEAITLTKFRAFAARRESLMKFIRKAAKMAPRFPVPLPVYLSPRRLLAGRTKPVWIGKGKGRVTYPLGFLASLFDAAPAKKLNCPWWLFAAKNDGLFTPKLTQTVFARVMAPEKTLVWLENGGHLFIMNPRLCEFVAKSVACALLARGGTINAENAN